MATTIEAALQQPVRQPAADVDDDEDFLPIESVTVKLVDADNDAIEEKTAYYIASKNINFRHEGVDKKKPLEVVLRDLTHGSYADRVLVYYSGSGSGKTCELAGSSVTRDCHLTLMLTIADGEKKHNVLEEDYPPQRKETMAVKTGGAESTPEQIAARQDDLQMMDKLLNFEITQILKKAKPSLQPIVQVAVANRQELKLVLAIDEASSCPRTVRAILRNGEYLKSVVLQCLDETDCCDDTRELMWSLKVSIAGTGVASSVIGSITQNFKVVPPYHDIDWKRAINNTLGNDEETIKLCVPGKPGLTAINDFSVIEESFPILAVLMENGRLESIAIAELRAGTTGGGNQKGNEEANEAKLVQRVVDRFMLSNGLNSLMGNREAEVKVAAAALAVHLFRKDKQFLLDVPSNQQAFDDWLAKMDFFYFQKSEELLSVREIVAVYGLLQPSLRMEQLSKHSTTTIPPLYMTSAQQLVAVHMLGLSVGDMLQPTWVGFEDMSTHLVKCAIAAATTVRWDKRPTVADTLKKIGFRSDKHCTGVRVKETWEKWKKWKPVSTSPTESYAPLHSRLRRAAVALEVVPGDNGSKPTIGIDENMRSSLVNITASRQGFGVPVSWINFGNSDLPDGFVTFFAVEVDEEEEFDGREEKFSIMIQAKDYHNETNIDAKKLNKHAAKASNSVFNGFFGDNDYRLVAVASTHKSLFATTRVAAREFMPYSVKESVLIRDLHSKLTEQRNPKRRREEHGCICDEKGKVVSRQRNT